MNEDFKTYLPLCSNFMLLDNEFEPKIIAQGTSNDTKIITDSIKWNLITSKYE